MTTAPAPKARKRINWAPYLLILPSLLYLALFFAWPMVQGLILAVREEGALLSLRADAERNSTIAGQLPRGTQVDILSQQGNQIPPGEPEQGDLLTEVWFRVRGESTDGQVIEAGRRNGASEFVNQTPTAYPLQVRFERSYQAAPIHSRAFTQKRMKAARSLGKWRHEFLLKFWIRLHWKFGF